MTGVKKHQQKVLILRGGHVLWSIVRMTKDANYKMDIGCSGYIDNCRRESNDTKGNESFYYTSV
jgi:hypothetical protein